MASSGYTAITFVANEQPTTAKWNLIGSNDASFNNGNGFEDGIIINRHMANLAVKYANNDLSTYPLVSVNANTTALMATAINNLLAVSGTQINTVPTAFTIDTVNRRIVIGSGVTRVKISINLMFENVSSQYLYARMRKNGVEIAQTLNNKATTTYVGAAMPERVVDVVAGDYIDCILDVTGDMRSQNTYYTVQALKG